MQWDHGNYFSGSVQQDPELALQKELSDIHYSGVTKGFKVLVTAVSEVHAPNNSFSLFFQVNMVLEQHFDQRFS